LNSDKKNLKNFERKLKHDFSNLESEEEKSKRIQAQDWWTRSWRK
jgi:hypothetical protein